jgi:death-on-curing protein
VSVQYLDLADYLAVAVVITGLDPLVLHASTKVDLADSALHAPSAIFGDQEFYPDFVDKSAVLLVRLVKNHPLLDGNKRAAWVTLRIFVEMNGWSWAPYPSVDEAERAVLAVAASEWDEDRTAQWLRQWLRAPPSEVIGNVDDRH